jgi:hypothetical protein
MSEIVNRAMTTVATGTVDQRKAKTATVIRRLRNTARSRKKKRRVVGGMEKLKAMVDARARLEHVGHGATASMFEQWVT